ncbi:MAG: hypothetical protein ACKVOA_01500 [Methylophilaceae bacterium]
MNTKKLIGQTKLRGNENCKVRYNQRRDTVVLELGGISLTLDAHNFMMVNEMMRKAAARLVMRIEL